jgi:hypothetical protein
MTQLVTETQFASLVLKLSSAYATALSCRDEAIRSALHQESDDIEALSRQEREEIRKKNDEVPAQAESSTAWMAQEAQSISDEARRLLEKAGEEYTGLSSDPEVSPASAASAFAEVTLGIEDLRFRLVVLARAALEEGDTSKALRVAEAVLSEKPISPALESKLGDVLGRISSALLTGPETVRLRAIVASNKAMAAAIEEGLLERRLHNAVADGEWKLAKDLVATIRSQGRDALLRSTAWIDLLAALDTDDDSGDERLRLVEDWRKSAPLNPRLVATAQGLHRRAVSRLVEKGAWEDAIKARKRALVSGCLSIELDPLFDQCPLPMWAHRTPARSFMQVVRSPDGSAAISPSGSLIAHVTGGSSPVMDLYDVPRDLLLGSVQLPEGWSGCVIDFPAEGNVRVGNPGDKSSRFIQLDDLTNPAGWASLDTPFGNWPDKNHSGMVFVDADTDGSVSVTDRTAGMYSIKTLARIQTPYSDRRTWGIARSCRAVFVLYASRKLCVWAPSGDFFGQ